MSLLVFIRRYWLACTLLLWAVIAVLSLIPIQEVPPAPGNDKLHHLLAYAALSLPVCLRKPRFHWLILLLFLSSSGAIELIQPYVNRYGEWLDMLANGSGILLGLILAELLIRYIPARLNHSRSQED